MQAAANEAYSERANLVTKVAQRHRLHLHTGTLRSIVAKGNSSCMMVCLLNNVKVRARKEKTTPEAHNSQGGLGLT